MEESSGNLDVEYRRYMQIMRPYLGQLVDEDAITICNSWIKRLSNCSEGEKPMRNRYVFVLCYQLAKGILDMPFLSSPPVEELCPIPEVMDSDVSSEVIEYVTEADDDMTKILYTSKRNIPTDTECLSQNIDFDQENSSKDFDRNPSITEKDEKPSSETTRKQTIFCYTCPEMMRACAAEVRNGQDHYEYRANNLILRLREIKKQNMLLHNELVALKKESRENRSRDSLEKVDHSTSALRNPSHATVRSMRNKLQDAEEDKFNLLDTISSLQEQLDNVHEIKRLELEDLQAKHKLEIAKLKAMLRDESKDIYDERLDELRNYYEDFIGGIKQNNDSEVSNMKKLFNDAIIEKDKIIQETEKSLQEKDKEVKDKEITIERQNKTIAELNAVVHEKDNILKDKTRIIEEKDNVIATLKIQIEDHNQSLQTILSKFLEKPNPDLSADSMKLKAKEFEKRLIKMEKSKTKCARIYEGKLAHLQREKHLAECSMQLQIVRHRAQVVNEIAEENQLELTEVLDKLEAKYKDIVANIQSAAIHSRMQDQIALNAVLNSACGLRNDVTNVSQLSGQTVLKPKEETLSCDGEFSGVMNSATKSKGYGDDGSPAGYCLNGERFGELFEKMHIPQRDIGDK